MNKVFILIKREYRAAVKTKGFIISLVLLPILMGGSAAVIYLTQDKVDTKDKVIYVIDDSNFVGESLIQSAEYRNENEIRDPESGEKKKPAYLLEIISKEADFNQQKLNLSDRVRKKEIHAFVHVGAEVLNPGENRGLSRIFYYAENSTMDDARGWVSGQANYAIRQARVAQLDLSEEEVQTLFTPVWAEGMGLMSVDTKTGEVQDAKVSSEIESFAVPYVMLLLIFMMIMMSSVPLLQAVMEEKSYRIAEVLLGSITPWQFMLGKVLGGLAVSLTIAAIYIAGIVLTLQNIEIPFEIPYHIFPWFFVYLIFAVIMFGTIMASLGSTCNDSKDAQNIQFPAMLPIMLPLFVFFPVLRDPLSDFSTWMSLFPPFTPTLMLVRQATPVEIPMWQPIVGIIGIILFTLLTVWAGGRLFRSSIIMVGKRPKFGTMIKYILKG